MTGVIWAIALAFRRHYSRRAEKKVATRFVWSGKRVSFATADAVFPSSHQPTRLCERDRSRLGDP